MIRAKAIRPETWKQINETLVGQAVANEEVDPSIIRTDTTAVETNIHWPTDSSLLWDTYRVAARLMCAGREMFPASCPHRFHVDKIKKLHRMALLIAKSCCRIELRVGGVS